MIRYLLLDLDNTIYSQSCGLWEAIGCRINEFMIERLGMAHDEVTGRRQRYMNEFGTTLNALRHYYGVDPDDFLAFVHDLPLARYLRLEPALDAMLARLPVRKVILTNADAAHARRVLARLGVGRHFEQIIDIRTLEFVTKPDRRAYLKALQLIGALPGECIFVDDHPANIAAAKSLGLWTVLVRDGCAAPFTGADYVIRQIHELGGIIGSRVSSP